MYSHCPSGIKVTKEKNTNSIISEVINFALQFDFNEVCLVSVKTLRCRYESPFIKTRYVRSRTIFFFDFFLPSKSEHVGLLTLSQRFPSILYLEFLSKQ